MFTNSTVQYSTVPVANIVAQAGMLLATLGTRPRENPRRPPTAVESGHNYLHILQTKKKRQIQIERAG